MTQATTTPLWALLTLADVPETPGCLLTAEQLVRLGELLLQHAPGAAVAGGALAGLARGTQHRHPLTVARGALAGEHFLLAAGPTGGLALLAASEGVGYHTRIFSDLETVDRVALVLSQFGDLSSIEAIDTAANQPTLVLAFAHSLASDPHLRQIDLAALLPEAALPADLARLPASAATTFATASPPTPAELVPNPPLALTAELLAALRDGVLLVDARGQIIAFNQLAAQLAGLPPEASGSSLVETRAWPLAALLSDAMMGEAPGTRVIDLPGAAAVQVRLHETAPDTWAFVLAPPASHSPTTAGTMLLARLGRTLPPPLQALRAALMQLPTAGTLNPAQSDLLGQALRYVHSLALLTNDLLEIEGLRDTRLPPTSEVAIEQLVAALLETQRAEADRRNQQVTLRAAPNLPRLAVDKERLGRAFALLIDNAIKYSPAGATLMIDIALAGQQLIVTLSDSGVGLAPDELAQVFEPFYRAPGVLQSGVAGRGLGLTIARAVVQAHGGLISAESAPGQGSSFVVRLPL